MSDLDSIIDELNQTYGDDNIVKGIIARTDNHGQPVVIGKLKYDEDEDALYIAINEDKYIANIKGRNIDSFTDDNYHKVISSPSYDQLIALFNAPSGYLAKVLACHHPDDLTPRPEFWSNKEIMKSLLYSGGDISGGLMYFKNEEDMHKRMAKGIDKETAYNKNNGSEVDRLKEIQKDYDELIASSQSHIGGAKPKFLATRINEDGTYDKVMVKYSTPGSPMFDEENRQLILEHACLEALRANGVPAAETRIIKDPSTGQVFFESIREDRSRNNHQDKAPTHKHWISAQAWQITRGGDTDPVRLMTKQLANDLKHEKQTNGKISSEDKQGFENFITLAAFNYLIGNSDLHGGNLSFERKGIRSNGQVHHATSAAYDVEPYFMRTKEIKPAWLKNKNLHELQASDLPNGALFQKHKKPFELAKKIRSDMLQYTNELKKQGKLNNKDMQIINDAFANCRLQNKHTPDPNQSPGL